MCFCAQNRLAENRNCECYWLILRKASKIPLKIELRYFVTNAVKHIPSNKQHNQHLFHVKCHVGKFSKSSISVLGITQGLESLFVSESYLGMDWRTEFFMYHRGYRMMAALKNICWIFCNLMYTKIDFKERLKLIIGCFFSNFSQNVDGNP